MLRPMNERELNLGMPCDAIPCGDLATHCESETTDYPLLLCTVHALQHTTLHDGLVKLDSAWG